MAEWIYQELLGVFAFYSGGKCFESFAFLRNFELSVSFENNFEICAMLWVSWEKQVPSSGMFCNRSRNAE